MAMSSYLPGSLRPVETGFLSVGSSQMSPLQEKAKHMVFCDFFPDLTPYNVIQGPSCFIQNLWKHWLTWPVGAQELF